MNIKHKKIDRVIITGPIEDSPKALAYCDKHDYWIVRSGPMRLSLRTIDESRFKIVAEKEIK